MPRSFPRRLRVAEFVREEIADELIGVCPGALLTVRGVEMSANLSVAVVRCSTFGADPEVVQEVLRGMVGRLRTRLARKLRMRFVPKIQIVVEQLPDGG